ncbi:MAG: DUF4369 domain-containing protein [Urechidicola sp.]|nr:DUF4369 domain-containing protein [Urechidicola sp.]
MSLTLKDIGFVFLTLLFFSCNKQVEIPKSKTQYVINIHADDLDDKNLFLYKLSPKFSLIDSTLIINNTAYFKGKIDFPERYAIKVKGIDGGKLFVLENDSIKIVLDKNDLTQSTIKGSKLNDELVEFQNDSKQINAKIELLFPDLQRARLNNDAKTLEKIASQISAIEQENINFNFEYVNQHPTSFISAMILNDLSKREGIGVVRIFNAYQKLSNNVKQGVDSKEVELFLAL